MSVYKDVAGRPNALIQSASNDKPSSAFNTEMEERRLRGGSFSTTITPNFSVANFAAKDFAANVPAFFLVISLTVFVIGLSGCQTDQLTQMRINEMRAEQMALEDRYTALRNEYEKVRRRLVAEGDPLAKKNGEPSALPLVYPPGPSMLDQMNGDHFPDSGEYNDASEYQPGSDQPVAPMPPDGSINSVLEGASYRRGSNSTQMTATPVTAASVRMAPLGARINSLGIDLSQSHGFDRDQMSGDEGIQLLVLPLDAQGRLVMQSGDFQLTLFDYSQAEDVEIGTWRFPRSSIDQFVNRRGQKAGIPFRVSLKNYVLRSPEVMAEVRMTTKDGEQLSVREIIQVNLAHDWVNDSAYSLDDVHMQAQQPNIQLPTGYSAPNSVPNWPMQTGTDEIVPSFLPGGSGQPPVSTASQPVEVPAWSPERH